MKRTFAILTGCLALASGEIYAANWVKFGEDQAQTSFVDADSIALRGAVTLAWIKVVYRDPKSAPKVKNEPAGSLMARYHVRCSDRSLALGQGVMYSNSGRTLSSFSGEENKFSEAIPDSNGDAVVSVLCK